MSIDRVLPHDLEAERAVLGAILVNAKLVDQVVGFLRPEEFFRVAHRELFAAMLRLSERRVEIDPITLMDDLRRGGWADEVGGPAYIANLTDGVPHTSNIRHYAEIVKDAARRRGLIHAVTQALGLAYDGERPTDEIIQEVDRELLALQRGGHGTTVDLRESFGDLVNAIEARHQNKGQLLGLDTGFQSINDLTSGWLPGDMVVIAARPSIGKTAFMLNSIEHVAAQNHAVLVCSLEMRLRQLEYRRLSSLSQVPLTRIINGWLGDPDFEKLGPATGVMGSSPIHVVDRHGMTVQDIRTLARLARAERKVELIVVDYVQLVTGSLERRGATRSEELADVSRRLKVLADEVSCPVLVLSQLNRQGDTRADKRPILSDLRETGALEQDADIVAFLHRANHRESGVTEFIIEKQRNGPTGVVRLNFTRETQTFVDAGVEDSTPTQPVQESLADDLKHKKNRRKREVTW